MDYGHFGLKWGIANYGGTFFRRSHKSSSIALKIGQN